MDAWEPRDIDGLGIIAVSVADWRDDDQAGYIPPEK
jgi:hypothetical protein